MIRIEAVQPGSMVAEMGLSPGTELLTVNGRPLHDFLDWEFLTAEETFVLDTRDPSGQRIEYDIERPLEEPLGAVLEPPRIRRCANRCDFCFVDGLPDGLRDVLYIRDDDYRLSFRYGNFATLTNLKPWDVDRIVEYRLSPLYVSVHATDPTTRRHLLRNPTAPDILEQLQFFAAAQIQFHTQIVLSPGVNDGPILDQTLDALWGLGDAVLSVSVVPVGLTEFSKHSLVREPTAEECGRAINQLETWGKRALRTRSIQWVYGADELYLRANRALPPASAYDGFDQAENGVGSVRYLQQAIEEAGPLESFEDKRVLVCTGTSMGPLMPEVVSVLAAHTRGEFQICALENSLFGPRVTTAGLLPGQAFIDALTGQVGYDLALLPGEAVNDGALFLDGISLDAVQAAVPMPVWLSKTFVDALTLESETTT